MPISPAVPPSITLPANQALRPDTIPGLRQIASRPWFLALALLFWFSALAWLRPLTLPDEGRYASVAWEMFSQGSWLTPLIDGMPYFHKPPLYYWLSAGAYGALGAAPWVARLPSALAAALATIGLYIFLRRTLSPLVAARALVVLATTPLFYGAAQFANHDMLVAALITLTILAGSWALGLGDSPRTGPAALLAALFAALAVLSKGLIGIALPGLTLLIWAIVTRRSRQLTRLLSPGPLLVFVLTVLPWFAVMQYRHPDFFHYFFIYQQVERFASGGFNNTQPFWFYLPVLALGGLPWTGVALHHAWRARQVHHVAATARRERLDDVTRLAWVWAGVMLVFFSIPGSKLIGYILPALPALAMLVAVKSTTFFRAGARIAVLVCVAMPLTATLVARPGTADLAKVLAENGRPSDITVALETYPFDLNLQAHRHTPLWVVDNWPDPALPARDNWRKELADAATFATPEAGERRLISQQTLAERLCAAPLGTRVWLWARLRMQTRYPMLQQATLAAQNADNGLWLWEKKHACTGKAAPSEPASARSGGHRRQLLAAPLRTQFDRAVMAMTLRTPWMGVLLTTALAGSDGRLPPKAKAATP